MQKKTSLLQYILNFTLVSSLAVTSGATFAKEYYKWVDSNGSTHYTTTPPPKNAKKKGTVETYGWRNSSAVSPAPTANLPAPSENPTPEQQTPAVMDPQQREANEALQNKEIEFSSEKQLVH